MTENTDDIPIGTTREWHGCLLTYTEDGWRAEVKHNMHRRCKGWDYCQPWIYLVTIDAQHHEVMPMPTGRDGQQLKNADGSNYELPEWLQKQYLKSGHPHLFGELAKEKNGKGEAWISLNEFGRAVEKEIAGIPAHHPEVRILKQVVMPNHVHFVIRVVQQLPQSHPLGWIINQWKSGINQLFKEVVLGLPKSTRMQIAQKRDVLAVKSGNPADYRTRLASIERIRAKHGGHGTTNPDTGLVFEPNFHDRILFRSGQLDAMLNYVADNPRRLWELVHNRQNFEKIHDLRITMPLVLEGGTKGYHSWGATNGLVAPVEYKRTSAAAPAECGMNACNAAPADSPCQCTFTFNALGNHSLLSAPERMQVQCSRRMTAAEIETLKEDVLEACRHGVVPVSPCISPGEKAVARAVMDAGFGLIVIWANGIPPMTDEYKPYGQYFDACSRGQLLILAPWKYMPGVKHISRGECLMMNSISCQLAMM